MYYISFETPLIQRPILLARKGRNKEIFIDKLNPRFYDELTYHKRNFITQNQNMNFTKNSFFGKFYKSLKDDETKKGKESFGSGESVSTDKNLLGKRDSKKLEEEIMEKRLNNFASSYAMQDSLFENLQFPEKSFYEKFKRIKPK